MSAVTSGGAKVMEFFGAHGHGSDGDDDHEQQVRQRGAGSASANVGSADWVHVVGTVSQCSCFQWAGWHGGYGRGADKNGWVHQNG